MFVGHAILVGHVIGRHIVDAKEADGFAVNADFILAFEDGGKLPFRFWFQPVYRHLVRQFINKHAVFIERYGYIAVLCVNGETETEVISLVCFLLK